jgi:hypothetical protein
MSIETPWAIQFMSEPYSQVLFPISVNSIRKAKTFHS